MSPGRHLRASAAALALCAGLAAAPARAASTGGEAALMKALLHSRELWATIDVCSPADQRDYVGVRGSMPGDRRRADRMYMSFALQYEDAATHAWVNLKSAAGTSWMLVGAGGSVRQGGASFKIVPGSGRTGYTLRGVVRYEWRRGGRVVQSTSRTTEPGHKSLAGADPAGYSAASCLLG
jgi:hypothetical protein